MEPNNLKENILQKIREGKVLMRPRWHFMLQVAALVLVALAVLVVSILIFNALLFSIRVNHHEQYLRYGPSGYVLFLQFFPWLLLALDIVLIGVLEWMLRQFRFAYKLPALYLLAVLFVLTMSLGLFVEEQTPFNDRLREEARHHRLPPPFNDFYSRDNVPMPRDPR